MLAKYLENLLERIAQLSHNGVPHFQRSTGFEEKDKHIPNMFQFAAIEFGQIAGP
jgi:hypothetical protein